VLIVNKTLLKYSRKYLVFCKVIIRLLIGAYLCPFSLFFCLMFLNKLIKLIRKNIHLLMELYCNMFVLVHILMKTYWIFCCLLKLIFLIKLKI